MKWNLVQKHEDVIYEKSGTGIAKITINRPEVRNAFRPQTLFELQKCFEDVREIQKALTSRGLEPTLKADESTTGPASLMLVDPDGNQILVDQYVPSPKRK